MPQILIDTEEALKLMLSGSVEVTLRNKISGNQFKYYVRVEKVNKDVWDVRPDVNSPESLGEIRREYNIYDKARTTIFFKTYGWSQQHVIFQSVFRKLLKRELFQSVEILIEPLNK